MNNIVWLILGFVVITTWTLFFTIRNRRQKVGGLESLLEKFECSVPLYITCFVPSFFISSPRPDLGFANEVIGYVAVSIGFLAYTMQVYIALKLLHKR